MAVSNTSVRRLLVDMIEPFTIFICLYYELFLNLIEYLFKSHLKYTSELLQKSKEVTFRKQKCKRIRSTNWSYRRTGLWKPINNTQYGAEHDAWAQETTVRKMKAGLKRREPEVHGRAVGKLKYASSQIQVVTHDTHVVG